MKQIYYNCVMLLPLLVSSLLMSCGSAQNAAVEKCAGSYTGDWAGVTVPNSTLTLSGDCTFAYARTNAAVCQSQGTYASPISTTSGSVAVTIAAVTGAGCLPVGSYTCAYVISGRSGLAMDCGTGAQSYTK